MKIHRLLTLLALSSFSLHPSSFCRAQGSLTPPPGAPVPTMKTLDQIEPRIPVNAATCPGDADAVHVISQPGSYFLAGNFTGVAGKSGIRITVSNVTLDLGGFNFTGVTEAKRGIFIDNYVAVSISNGFIRDWPILGIQSFGTGVFRNLTYSGNGQILNGNPLGGGLSTNGPCSIEDCIFTNNVALGAGVNGGGASIVRCHAGGNGGTGIHAGSGATLHQCSAISNGSGITISGGTAIGCTASYNEADGFYGSAVFTDCVASENGTGFDASGTLTRCSANHNKASGFEIFSYSTLESCNALANDLHGIECEDYCLVQNCSATFNNSDGIRVTGKCVIRNCLASKNGTAGVGAGIHATSGGNRVEGNETRENLGHGIKCDAGPEGDFILSNTSRSNPVNYSPGTGSTFAPVQSLATQTNPSANH